MISFYCDSSTTSNFSMIGEKVEQEVLYRLQDSYTLGMAGKGVLDELNAVFEECSMPDWNGYGAAPVSPSILPVARAFLEKLPLGTPAPSVGADPDGDITFEWYSSPNRVLSVSLSPKGELNFAALINSSKRHGSEKFWGDVIPRDLRELILKVKP